MEFDQSFLPQESRSDDVPAQPAMRLLSFVESRTAYLMAQTERAIAILLNVNAQSESASNRMASSPELVTKRVTIHDLERYAPQWANLIPDEAAVQAAITHIFAKKIYLDLRRAASDSSGACFR